MDVLIKHCWVYSIMEEHPKENVEEWLIEWFKSSIDDYYRLFKDECFYKYTSLGDGYSQVLAKIRLWHGTYYLIKDLDLEREDECKPLDFYYIEKTVKKSEVLYDMITHDNNHRLFNMGGKNEYIGFLFDE